MSTGRVKDGQPPGVCGGRQKKRKPGTATKLSLLPDTPVVNKKALRKQALENSIYD